MKYAIVTLGYDTAYHVPVKQLSAFLAALELATPVSRKWGTDHNVAYVQDLARPGECSLTNDLPMSIEAWHQREQQLQAKQVAEAAGEPVEETAE